MICQSGSLSLSLSRPLSSPRSPSSRSPTPTSLTETLSAQDGVLQPSVELYSTAALEAEPQRELHDAAAVLVVLREAAEISARIVELSLGDRHAQVGRGSGGRDRMVQDVVGRHPELQVLPAADREILVERQVVVPVRLPLDVREDEVPELPHPGGGEAGGVEQVAAGNVLPGVAGDDGLHGDVRASVDGLG